MREINIDVSNDAYIARMAIVEAAGLASRPSVLYRPEISADGNMWCALLGADLQTGVAGFGETPSAAMEAFDRAFYNDHTPGAQIASRIRGGLITPHPTPVDPPAPLHTGSTEP